LLRILVLINLAMRAIAGTMELRPLQFFYMMSHDQRSLCDGRMLALVVQAFSQHIVNGEMARRSLPTAQKFPIIELAETHDNDGITNLAFCAFDLLSKSPTVGLAYGTLLHCLEQKQYRTWIVVCSRLTEEEGKDGKLCPYDASYPPAVELANMFAGRILFLWSDWKDDAIVNAMRMQKFRILIHLN
jgi:hypothetical protein